MPTAIFHFVQYRVVPLVLIRHRCRFSLLQQTFPTLSHHLESIIPLQLVSGWIVSWLTSIRRRVTVELLLSILIVGHLQTNDIAESFRTAEA